MKRLDISVFKFYAQERGGVCLSDAYINQKVKLSWRCKEGHEWNASPNNVFYRKQWCPTCANKNRNNNVRGTVEEMKILARLRGGKFLSKVYIDTDTNHLWMCHMGHRFYRAPKAVKASGWCSKCKESRAERICRIWMETLLKAKFPKARPSWLVNELNNRMELDGYNPRLGIAFEYQGRQHFEEFNLFTKKMTFERLVKNDEIKKKLCKSKGIKLLVIPSSIKFEKMGVFIKNQCAEMGIGLAKEKSINDYKLFNVFNPGQIDEMKKIAISRSGKCLSKVYVNASTKLMWICSKGHKWEATPNDVKSGKWCRICSLKNAGFRRRAKTLESIKALARSKGGECLSTEYINGSTPLLWKCKNGHQWKVSYSDIRQGYWCGVCKRYPDKTKKLAELKKLAALKGGFCLSDEYIDNKTKMKWKCKNGHIWFQKSSHIKDGHWCRFCVRNKKMGSHWIANMSTS